MERVDRYFAQGMAKLTETQAQVKPISQQLIAVLDDGTDDGAEKQTAIEFLALWDELPDLETRYQGYLQPDRARAAAQYRPEAESLEAQNLAQQQLSKALSPFFIDLPRD